MTTNLAAIAPHVHPVELYVTSPSWWQQRGLSDGSWVNVGLVPAALCFIAGWTIATVGTSPLTRGAGVWTVLGGLAIAVYYALITF